MCVESFHYSLYKRFAVQHMSICHFLTNSIMRNYCVLILLNSDMLNTLYHQHHQKTHCPTDPFIDYKPV